MSDAPTRQETAPSTPTAPLVVTERATAPSPLASALARVRTPLVTTVLVMWAARTALGLAERWTSPSVQIAASLSSLAFLMLLIVVLALLRFGSGTPPASRVIAPPVAGRWRAGSTPAHRVPSHGTHLFAQTYAIDMLAEPDEHTRPRFGGFGWTRPASDFPGFAAPVLASDHATVVHVDDGQRDHRSRTTWTTLPLLLADGIVRGILSYRYVFGNHVVLDLGDGTYLAYAHLQRDSITVTAGDHVRVGQQIARCGNSGNSSEPHLHIQLMDRPQPARAAGLPFALSDTTLEGSAGQRADHAVVPAREQAFTTSTTEPGPAEPSEATTTNPQPGTRPLLPNRTS